MPSLYIYLDHSFLLNLALYDGFYFSGFADQTGSFGTSGRTPAVLAGDFAKGIPLDDPRLVLRLPNGKTAADLGPAVTASTAFKSIASWQTMNGAFNINSTSVPAWKAMLASIHDAQYLVAVPKTPGSLPWRVFVIEDSAKNFPDGGAFVANFHSQDIRFVIGENKLMLHPAGSHGVARPTQRDDFNMAAVAFQFQQGDTWRDASESMIRFLPGLRYLMFAFVDPASCRPRVVTFQDQATTAAAPAAKVR